MSRVDEAIAKFEALLLSGRIQAGDRLPPERELALDLGCSRPVVHAALTALQARGLVRVEPRRGAFAEDWRRSGSVELLLSMLAYSDGDLAPGLFDGLLEMRILIETETARLAALRLSPERLDEIERILARERLAVEPGPDAMVDLDYDFHLAVALASGNDVYPLLLNSFKRVYRAILAVFYADPAVVAPVFALHRKLGSAIASRDGRGAADAMREILEFGERHLRRAIVRAKGTA
ncbi:MAG: FCD domain-containing protein [Spirochaetaceae bacterium]|nr:FCD domain-containing protein [Spirochaetaceae bacterium]